MPEHLHDLNAVVIGAAKQGRSFNSLHLKHPLVVAALDHARRSILREGAVARVRVARPELVGLRGRRGRMQLLRSTHRNFEVTEHLVPLILLDGDDAPLPVATARVLLDEPMEELPSSERRSTVTSEALADALDELMFDDTSAASRLEQPRFEQTLEQIERFISDRVLLLERERDAARARLGKAQDARDHAVGAEQRGAAERAFRRVQTELEQLDEQLRLLRAGDDERYQKWRRHAETRRYTPPDIEHLCDLELEII